MRTGAYVAVSCVGDVRFEDPGWQCNFARALVGACTALEPEVTVTALGDKNHNRVYQSTL